MNAEEARQLTNENIGILEGKYQTQYKEFMALIVEAATQGESKIVVDKILDHYYEKAVERLRESGYETFYFSSSPSIQISW